MKTSWFQNADLIFFRRLLRKSIEINYNGFLQISKHRKNVKFKFWNQDFFMIKYYFLVWIFLCPPIKYVQKMISIWSQNHRLGQAMKNVPKMQLQPFLERPSYLKWSRGFLSVFLLLGKFRVGVDFLQKNIVFSRPKRFFENSWNNIFRIFLENFLKFSEFY